MKFTNVSSSLTLFSIYCTIVIVINFRDIITVNGQRTSLDKYLNEYRVFRNSLFKYIGRSDTTSAYIYNLKRNVSGMLLRCRLLFYFRFFFLNPETNQKFPENSNSKWAKILFLYLQKLNLSYCILDECLSLWAHRAASLPPILYFDLHAGL